MQEPVAKRKGNIYVCEEPYFANLIEWGSKYKGTLVAIEFESEGSLEGYVQAYCEKQYGAELHRMYRDNLNISIAVAPNIDVGNMLGGAYIFL